MNIGILNISKMKNILMSKKPEFKLRHVKMSDLPAYFEIMRDKQVQKNFMNAPKTIKEARKKLKEKILGFKKKKPTQESFAIIVDDKVAGFVDLHDLNKKYFLHRGIIGYCLVPEYRGKGITTKAVKMITDYAFKKYKLRRLEAFCRTFNKASARVLEKAGYKLEGILRKNKCKNGKYLDDMVWAKVK